MKIYYDHLLQPPNSSTGPKAPSPHSSNLFTRKTHQTGPAIGFQNPSKSHTLIYFLALSDLFLDWTSVCVITFNQDWAEPMLRLCISSTVK